MGKPTGFLEFDRELPKKRDLKERINDYNYVLAGRLRSCWSPDQRSVRFIKMQLVTVLDESRFYRFWFYRVAGQATHNNLEFTQSKLAAHILSYWQTAFKQFIKVMPIDYKAVLEKKRITQLTIK